MVPKQLWYVCQGGGDSYKQALPTALLRATTQQFNRERWAPETLLLPPPSANDPPTRANMPSDYAIRRKPYPTASATIEYVKMQQPGGEEDIGESRQLPDAEKERQAGRSGRSLFGLWKYELLSILGSCLAFAAIVVLLRVFDEQDLSSWKSIISINTFISILTTLFKGAVAVTLSSGMMSLLLSLSSCTIT